MTSTDDLAPSVDGTRTPLALFVGDSSIAPSAMTALSEDGWFCRFVDEFEFDRWSHRADLICTCVSQLGLPQGFLESIERRRNRFGWFVIRDSKARVEPNKWYQLGADGCFTVPIEFDCLVFRARRVLSWHRTVSDLSKANRQLKQIAMYDALTNLPNHRFARSRFVDEFRRAERYREPLACAIIDFDGLSRFAAKNGVSKTEKVLQSAAKIMSESVRDVDQIFRIDEDDFFALFPVTHFSGSVAATERIWLALTNPGIWRRHLGEESSAEENEPLSLSISIGMALFPSRDIKEPSALIRGALDALAKAKLEGGNRICVYQQDGFIYTPVSGAAAPDFVSRHAERTPIPRRRVLEDLLLGGSSHASSQMPAFSSPVSSIPPPRLGAMDARGPSEPPPRSR